MANMSNYLENKLVDHVLRGTTYNVPSSMAIALCTSTPTDASTGSTIAEVTGGSYARQGVPNNAQKWFSTDGNTVGVSSGTNGTISLAVALTFPTATADWGTINSMVICDNITTAAGNVLFWGTLSSPKVITNGDQCVFAGDGTALSIQIDN